MKFGLHGINMAALSEPEAIKLAAQAAESAGYESLWTAEHVVLIDPREPPSPVAPEARMVDTVATLAFLAACTERIMLGSGVILLPQRNPVVLAKELAGVDVLSNGRLLFGLGVGYVEGEFSAIGVPFNERGARTTEHIEAIRALWTQDKPEFQGRFTSFSGIQSHPMPVQKPHPPIIVGGSTPAAYRRAVAHGNGYYGFAQDIEATAETLQGLERAADEVERPPELGKLEITITPPRTPDAETVEGYAEIGVERLVLMGPGRRGPGSDETVAFLEHTAEQLKIS